MKRLILAHLYFLGNGIYQLCCAKVHLNKHQGIRLGYQRKLLLCLKVPYCEKLTFSRIWGVILGLWCCHTQLNAVDPDSNLAGGPVLHVTSPISLHFPLYPLSNKRCLCLKKKYKKQNKKKEKKNDHPCFFE